MGGGTKRCRLHGSLENSAGCGSKTGTLNGTLVNGPPTKNKMRSISWWLDFDHPTRDRRAELRVSSSPKTPGTSLTKQKQKQRAAPKVAPGKRAESARRSPDPDVALESYGRCFFAVVENVPRASCKGHYTKVFVFSQLM